MTDDSARERLLRAIDALEEAPMYRVPNREGFYVSLDLVLEIENATTAVLEALSQTDGWKEIESAPLDTLLLLSLPGDADYTEPRVRLGEIWPRGQDMMPDRTAYIYGDSDMAETIYPHHGDYPTHWRPLPDPMRP